MANTQAISRIRQMIIEKKQQIEHLEYSITALADPVWDRMDSMEEAADNRSTVLEGLAAANEKTRREIDAAREVEAISRKLDKGLAPTPHRRGSGDPNPPKHGN